MQAASAVSRAWPPDKFLLKISVQAPRCKQDITLLTKIKHMAKSFEVITEEIHHPKHPFWKADNRSKKPQKSRYERRKIR